MLTHSDFNPKRLKDLLAPRTRTTPDLDQAFLHYPLLHVDMTRQTGVSKILETLYSPVTTGRAPGFGELPVTYISSVLTAVRPPD